MTMVTRPADGIAAAPTAANVEVPAMTTMCATVSGSSCICAMKMTVSAS